MYTAKGNSLCALPPLSGHQYSRSVVETDMLAKGKKPKAAPGKRVSLKQP